MNEIEKMYENAGVKPIKQGYCDWDCDCPYPDIINNSCGDDCPYWKYEDEAKYPPFTAEKQLELVKLLAKSNDIYIIYFPSDNTYNIRYCVSGFYDGSIMGNKEVTSVNFEETLAGIINNVWQDLTEEERKQIKDILK